MSTCSPIPPPALLPARRSMRTIASLSLLFLVLLAACTEEATEPVPTSQPPATVPSPGTDPFAAEAMEVSDEGEEGDEETVKEEADITYTHVVPSRL
jgi:hypothetical protein